MSKKGKRNNVNPNSKEQMENIFSSLNNSNRVTKSSKDKPQSVDERTKKWAINDKIVKLFESSIYDEINIKSKYATILIIFLGLQLIALNGIFILVGRGILIYSDFAFNLFISGGLAEIFILIRVIVKHLFNNNLSEALKIILDRNNQKLDNYKQYNKKNNIKRNNEIENNQEQR